MEAYLEGTLSPGERAELEEVVRTDADVRARFLDHVRLDVRLHGERAVVDETKAVALILSVDSDARRAEVWRMVEARLRARRAPTKSVVWPWVAAAAVLAGILYAAGRLSGPGGRPASAVAPLAATLELVEGTVALNGAPARADQAVRRGDRLETSAGQAALRLADGTRIELRSETRLSPIDGRAVRVDRGELHARVVLRPGERPLVFETPHGEARVLGTVLRLLVDSATRLDVTKGTVRLTRGAQSVEVPAGHYAIAGARAELAARPIPPAGIAVLSFTLINADTDEPIPGFDPVPDGAVIRLSRLPTRRLNLRANTTPDRVGCVQFALDGNPSFNVEREPPYALVTGAGPPGDFSAWTPPVGGRVVTATPWTGPPAPGKRAGTGEPGQALTIRFDVVER